MDFLQLIKSRTSCRSYQEKTIPDDNIHKILKKRSLNENFTFFIDKECKSK